MKVRYKPDFGCFLLMAAPTLLGCVATNPLVGVPGGSGTSRDSDQAPLRIVVMDPLSGQLACDCVEGYAQRKYGKLAVFLKKKLKRPVWVAYAENLPGLLRRYPGTVDLIIGKRSMVSFDAAEAGMSVVPIASLTDRNGSPDLTGLFVVRQDDTARSITDLKNYRILFGPKCEAEKSSAATAALKTKRVPLPREILRSSSCSTAALTVVEKEADAAVISSYALALLEGCDTIDKGALRVIGRTAPVPFVTVFATDTVTHASREEIVRALLAVKDDKRLLTQLESKAGFVPLPAPPTDKKALAAPTGTIGWTDWRGPNRDGLSPYVPDELPAKATFLWRRPLTGLGPSGVAATSRHVIVADKDKQNKLDVFRCLDANTGKQIWALEYPAPEELDFSNSPRANPVIHQGLVYLLGAFGDLHCVELDTGRVVWKTNIVKAFGAELVAWGTCAVPLIVDDRIIVNPGAKDASIAALDRRTGKVLWKTAGEEAAYSSFIVGTFGGVRQIVGYDAISFGGWEPDSGRRLWTLLPPEEGDFNVPTPVNVDGKLLVATENNGTRLYGFDKNGRIRPKPLAQNLDLAPDCSTPVVINGLVFGCFEKLFCLDAGNGLRTRWSAEGEAFEDYVSLIAGNDRVLITTINGDLLLVRADGNRYTLRSRLRLFEDNEVWSHPALVDKRLYVRNRNEVVCMLLDI